MSRGRDWARRAVLSALAGGGLTAAPLTGGGALAAETPPGSVGTPASASSSGEQGGPSTETTTTDTTTSTGTTPAPSTTPSSTTPAPAPTATAPTPQATPAPNGSSAQPQSSSKRPTAPHSSSGATRRKQQAGKGAHAKGQSKANPGGTSPSQAAPAPEAVQAPAPGASGNIAPAPQLAAGQIAAPPPLLSGSLASLQALSFYHVPLFLLPIYRAASAQYGVPWQVLAAINEVETDYGTDVAVSTAGAVGWMQFMPETWLQYGVDAVNAGYADPYNPVDAIFAAARYLHAAGASQSLQGAIFSYNHSQAYVQSVMLRARLISSYPSSVIDTLTGLTEGSVPVQGGKLLSAGSTADGEASAEAPATSVAPVPSAAATASLPGTTPAPAPDRSAANVAKLANAPAPLSQLSLLEGPKDAPVLAVEDGRIVQLGRSRKLGRYIVLRDTYGDVFTYAGLGSIVPSYRLPKPTPLSVPKGALRGGESGADPTPQQAATAGRQLPLTLHVAAKKGNASAGKGAVGPIAPTPVGSGKVRVFAHPGNPDALAAARAQAERSKLVPAGSNILTRGSLVAQGTVLGHLGVGGEGAQQHGYLRFAVRPPGAQQAIDPAPVLHNWAQLDAALHPQGAKGGNVLAGATANGAFMLSAGDLERSVLSDPGIRLTACDRHQVAAGKVDERMLALLVFLSRSGLKPTVGQLTCGRAWNQAGTLHTSYLPGGTLTITAINGVPVAGHQGTGTISDVTIRTLLTAKGRFAPKQIVSLMQYPGVAATVAKPDHASLIEVSLPPKAKHPTAVVAANGAGVRRPAGSPAGPVLGSAQWGRLIARIGGLADPKVSRKPSSAAIRDPRR